MVIKHSSGPVVEARKDIPWAETMVTNPAIIKDPESNRIHMLFRACGPWPEYKLEYAKYPPYLWVLGYSYSDDLGETWNTDRSRPAMMPAMNMTPETIRAINVHGKQVVDYANAYIEDPRFFTLDEKVYLTVCTRMFPVGPYWLDNTGDASWNQDYKPDWAKKPDNPFGLGVKSSGNVLYEVDMEKLNNRDYKSAFHVVTHLTDPEKGDNRDVFLFPEKFRINGKEQYLLMHRPVKPHNYPEVCPVEKKPSMFMSVAEKLVDFPTSKAMQHFMAEPLFDWEGVKIGASFPPIRVSSSEWLVSYHARHKVLGYTQSFMLMLEVENDFPIVVNRCPERMMYASMDWEQPKNFPLPCLFSCGGIVMNDTLIISYGAADEMGGIAKVNLASLVEHVKQYDALGKKL